MPGASIAGTPPCPAARRSGRCTRFDRARPPARPAAAGAVSPSSTLTIVDLDADAGWRRHRGSAGSCRRDRRATCAALVGLILPDVLALGAASGLPKAAINSPAKPSGTRMPTVSSPAVQADGSALSGCSGRTSVSGPGQKASASLRDSGIEDRHGAPPSRGPDICAISGLKRGRPLIS